MTKAVFAGLFVLALASCGKSAEDYGKEWCDCVQDAGDDMDKAKECNEILEEAQEKFEDDKDAEKEFKKGAGDCAK